MDLRGIEPTPGFSSGFTFSQTSFLVGTQVFRTNANIAKAQDGFIKNLIKPAFVHLSKMLPYLELNISYMDDNVEKWATKVIEYSNINQSPIDSTVQNVPI